MTVKEISEKWIADHAYYLWANNGFEHGKDHEHHEQAQKAWSNVQAKRWRLWNINARYELILDLYPADKDVKKRVEELIRLFYQWKDGDEGEIKSICFHNGYIVIWLDKKQSCSTLGYDWNICDLPLEYDWRTCNLPLDWDAPIEEPTQLILCFYRYQIQGKNSSQSIRQLTPQE